MNISNTPSYPACVAAKAAMIAEGDISKKSKAYTDKQKVYVEAVKTSAIEAGVNFPG